MADHIMTGSKSTASETAVSHETAVATADSLTFSQALNATATEADNIFVASQRGDVDLICRLLDSGQAKATDTDSQNITPLHWAAINAQLPACRLLLERGAVVDAVGGDLLATPMQWAARNGYLYVIQLLVAHSADPTITDAQGYNALHLATHSSSVMALLYLLQQPVGVDSRDSQGHTSLMWAAYQGDALSVELLLKHGADPNARDEASLTPLHWAVVRGNRACIRKLVERGAEVGAKDGEGRTPRDMAVELKSLGAWKRALEEVGMNDQGVRKSRPLSERNSKMAIFFLPTLFFFLIFNTLAVLPWYTGIILAFAEFFGMHHIVTRVLLNKSSYTESVQQSPYFAGIIFASMVWVGWSWATRLVQQTYSHAFTHLSFALLFGLCAYNFFRAITLDPGVCPLPGSETELKAIIEDLASEGRLNGQTFCIQCMARKPLRSKHCRVCDKCIARSDHHCPWVWNCVGVNNHRQFIVFVSTLVVGIVLFDYLTFAFFSSITVPSPPPPVSPSCALPTHLCVVVARDPFLVSVAAWATIQLSWTLVLLASQLWQAARQMTTLEVSNLGRWGFMGGRGGQSLGSQMGHRHQHSHPRGHGTSPSIDEDPLAPSDGLPAPAHAHRHPTGGVCAGCGSGFLLNLLGLDRFTRRGGASAGLALAARGKAVNPFDTGFVGNCRDFWTVGGELGVDYTRLYEIPPEGLVEAKKRREREAREEGAEGAGEEQGSKRTASGFLMGLGLGGRARDGYQRVPDSQV